MGLEIVDEGTSAYLTVTFKDKAGEQAIPDSINYRVDCLTNNKEIRGDTEITPPAAEVEIHLTPADNAIIDQANKTEAKLVTVKASYGAEDAINASYRYNLRNLKKVE